MSLFEALSFAPIMRGFVVLMAASAVFPLTGVFVLRMNLITLRFMLMHGTLLGSAIALAVGANPLVLAAAVNLFLVVLISWMSGSRGIPSGHLTTFFMVLSIGVAFAVIYRFEVPAKDTLAILWGNLFALRPLDLLLTIGFCVLIPAGLALLYGPLKAVLFSRPIAFTTGVDDTALYHGILVAVSLTVAFAVKLIGALLLDALLLLPAIVASLTARSVRGVFLTASAVGLVCGFFGFLLSLSLDIPASSAVTIVAAALFGASFLTRRRT